MSSKSTKKVISDSKVLLMLTCWSFLVLLFLSPDSPLFNTCHHIDSAWFFMEGKALMNGLRPYVDFSDCKGPLLWLVYGIGYLISPRNFFGMYVVGSLFYAATLFFNYKTARIFLKSNGTAVAATLPMIFVYFFPWFHYEVRSEDIMLLFISISIYILFKRLYSHKECINDAGDFFILGACFMALTLIKYNISAVQGVIVLIAFWDQYRRRASVAKAFFWAAMAAVIVAVPFLAYLWYTNTLGAFINDYFVVAFQVVAEENSDSPTYANDLTDVINDNRKITFIMAILVGGILLGSKLNRYRIVPVIIGLLFVAVSTRHNVWNYYYGVCYVFIIYLFIYALMITKPKLRNVVYVLLTGYVTLTCLYGNLIMGELRQITIFTQNPDKQAFQEIADVMKGTHHARLLNYECNEFGFGIPHEALPAGNQYACQNGATPEMMKDHKQILLDKKADFVITYCREDQPEKKVVLKEIEDAGYQLRKQCMYMDMPFYIYEKKK